MRDQFPGKCCRCGGIVEAGKGYVSGRPGDWDCEHEECVLVAHKLEAKRKAAQREYDL